MFQKPSKPSGQMIFGIRAVLEALHAGKEIDKIFIQNGLKGDLIQELKEVLHQREVFINYVPIEKVNNLTRANHQGVVAFVSPIVFADLENLVPMIFEKGETPLLVILDRVTDVRNFGAIVRSISCAGGHAVIIPARGSAQINEDAVKTSAGALHNVPVCKIQNMKTAIHFLKECGVSVLACTEKTESLIFDADLKGPVALLMGNEGEGISTEYLKLADSRAKIPITGPIESLNVSVATAICLFEAVKQRLG